MGNSDGTFGPPTTIAVEGSTTSVAVRDFNDDFRGSVGFIILALYFFEPTLVNL